MLMKSAAAFAVPDAEGSSRIEGAVTLRAARAAEPDELRAHLARVLPRYAVPDRLAVLDVMPRTSTGKIDRQELRRLALDRPSSGVPA